MTTTQQKLLCVRIRERALRIGADAWFVHTTTKITPRSTCHFVHTWRLA